MHTFLTILSTISFCLIPTAMANKLLDRFELTWNCNKRQANEHLFFFIFYLNLKQAHEAIKLNILLATY